MIAVGYYEAFGEQVAPFEGIGRYSGRAKKYEDMDLHGRRGAKSNLTNHSTLNRFHYTQRRELKNLLRRLSLIEGAEVFEED